MRAVLLAAALLASSCDGVPPRSPDIQGHLVDVVPGANGLGTIRVEQDPASSTGPKAIVRVTADTRIYRDVPPAEPITFDQLRAGTLARAKVWFTGPVAESYPLQATAEAIVVWTVAP